MNGSSKVGDSVRVRNWVQVKDAETGELLIDLPFFSAFSFLGLYLDVVDRRFLLSVKCGESVFNIETVPESPEIFEDAPGGS